MQNSDGSHLIRCLQRVNLQRIASALELEFINAEMVPFVLPNMFLIAEKATNDEYQKYIFPKLKQVFKIQKPAQVSWKHRWNDVLIPLSLCREVEHRDASCRYTRW